MKKNKKTRATSDLSASTIKNTPIGYVKGNLKETFDMMEHLYSLDDLENGVLNEWK